MNEHMPNWSTWQIPPPDPYFDQRVFQKLEAALHARPAPAPWWERWALAGALAGATALLVVSMARTPSASTDQRFAPIGTLTQAYQLAVKGY